MSKKNKKELEYEFINSDNIKDLQEVDSFAELTVSEIKEEKFQNPIHNRLSKLNNRASYIFCLLILQRFQPNFALFIKTSGLDINIANLYQQAIDVAWDLWLNDEKNQDKLDDILDNLQNYCEIIENAQCPALLKEIAEQNYIALCETINFFLMDDFTNINNISMVSIDNIVCYISDDIGRQLSISEYKEQEMIQDELDIQWFFYRELASANTKSKLIKVAKDLRNKLNNNLFSNLGIAK